MHKPRRHRLLAVALAVALVGCGSGGDDVPEGPVTLTKIPALDGYLDSLCTFAVRAGAYPKKLPCAQGIMGDAGRTLIDLDSAITAGTVIYRPDQAVQCAAEALSLPCTHASYDTLSSDCLLAFQATVAVDGTCHSDFECQAGTSCYGACASWEVVSCCIGTCTPKRAATPTNNVFAADGEPCTGANTVCEYITSYCEQTSGICVPKLPVGSQCTSEESCIGYAFCNGGKCQKQPGLGEKCRLPTGGIAKCLPGGCNQNDVCDIGTFVARCF